MQQSRIVLSSTLALSFCIALVFLLVSAGQVVKIECLKVKFECLKVKFEWLKGQRSIQHPEDI